MRRVCLNFYHVYDETVARKHSRSAAYIWDTVSHREYTARGEITCMPIFFILPRKEKKKKIRKEKEFNGSEHVCNAIILSLWYNEKDSLNLYKECSKCMLESITFVRRNERKREINFERIINILSIFTCKYRIIVEIPWYFI